MARTSRHTSHSDPHNSVSRELFRTFRRRYPNASSLQEIESGILPNYPADPEAYRLCREWEEAHDQYNRFQQETAFQDDGSDPSPTDALTLLTLPIAFRMHGRWQQSPACHHYDDTPHDRQLQRSFANACDALLSTLSPRDRAILDLHAEGHGPREIRQKLVLRLTEQRIGQIIQSMRKAGHARRAQHRSR